ncbi:hypothetical protein B1207_05145 [Legionella quinlivanii]|uniref:Acyltransferase n=1 Tax=Legionella quinlivanii TaxID=45073 RepID=A0A364LLE2_9GAMM|nr:acyltransferase family protein [Legionella quinlivanii]RAP37559.1 hypothetical protein B1207_05145 [Legionella quinlivanii]
MSAEKGSSVTKGAISLSSPGYRPDIDGLRAIAVLSVVLYHAFPGRLMGGFIGVDIFFILSGFLISTIIFENLERGTFSFAEFYARRIKRIFPALILVLIIIYIFGWFTLLADEFKQLGKHIAAGTGFVSNFVLMNEAGYFDNLADTKPLLHLWSLGIEEQFYIIWPLLLWFAWKRNFNLLTITIIAVSLSFYLNLVGVSQDITATFYSPQTRFWELLCGSLLAWLMLYHRKAFATVNTKLNAWINSILYHNAYQASSNTFSNILAFLGLLLLVFGFCEINMTVSFPGVWAVVPILGTILIISAGSDAWINRKILSNKVAVWFGLISFPLYLWHWPLLSFARILSVEYPTGIVRISIVLISIILSYLTYKFIEKPIRLGKHFQRLKIVLLLLLMPLCGLVAYNTYLENGYEFREVVNRVNSFYSPYAQQYENSLAKKYQNYLGEDISASKKPVVLIIGDSYTVNWASALSRHIDLDHFDVVSISYLGCDIRIDSQKITALSTANQFQSICETFQSFINNVSIIKRISSIMLVSHRPFEYVINPSRFDIIRWLKQKNAASDVFVFGNYFQLDEKKYLSCTHLMARARRGSETCLKYANYPLSEPKIETLPFYPKDLSFKYVDIIKLHCNYSRSGCATEANGVPFMSDWNHLNAAFLDFILQDIQIKKADVLAELGLLKYFTSDQKQRLASITDKVQDKV